MLELSQGEADKLGECLDYLASKDGPSINSDWSRISVSQALAAHEGWIKMLAKKAEKSNASLLDGCEKIQGGVVGAGAELAGTFWVELKTAQALSMEGAAMRHCVGSYAGQVEKSHKRIFSLRRENGKPLVTLELSKIESNEKQPPKGKNKKEADAFQLAQIRGLANAQIGPEAAEAVGVLLSSWENQGLQAVVGCASGLLPNKQKKGFAWMGDILGTSKVWLATSEEDRRLAVEHTKKAAESFALEQAIAASVGWESLGFHEARAIAMESLESIEKKELSKASLKEAAVVDAVSPQIEARALALEMLRAKPDAGYAPNKSARI